MHSVRAIKGTLLRDIRSLDDSGEEPPMPSRITMTGPVLLSWLLLAVTVVGAPPTSGPVTKPSSVRVLQVRGMVQVRNFPADPWQSAQVGMELAIGAELRTGVRSAVTFHVPPDQTVTV